MPEPTAPLCACGQPRQLVTTRTGSTYYQDVCRACLSERAALSAARRGGYAGQDRRQDSKGYIQVKINGKWVMEHKVVMERMLGRRLQTGESVRHRNLQRDDNRPENLILWIGGPRYGDVANLIRCAHCQKYNLITTQAL